MHILDKYILMLHILIKTHFIKINCKCLISKNLNEKLQNITPELKTSKYYTKIIFLKKVTSHFLKVRDKNSLFLYSNLSFTTMKQIKI